MEKKDKYSEPEDNKETSSGEDKIDTDIMKNPQKGFSGGIETEEYDILPELDKHEEMTAELEEKEGISIEYTFNGAEVTEGLTIYQATMLMKRNLIYSLILLVVFFMYMVNIVQNPGELFSVFLAIMCVAVLGFIWILPKTHVKKTAKAADLQEMHFSMVVYDNCIKIGEDNGSYIITYNKDVTNIFETPNLFLICAGKERIFILPKRCLHDDQEQELTSIFKDSMKEKFLQK